MNGGLQLHRNNTQDAIFLLTPKKRLDFIINHKQPLKLVRSLPSLDLLLTIREVGAADALELVELLSPKQVQEIFDLELWTNDELNIKRAGFYFSLLFEANRDQAISQIHGLDIELIGLMFKTVATIYDVTLQEEPADFTNLYSTSPDGRFIVCFSDEAEHKGLSQSLHLFLETLYGRDLVFALRLLENIRYELASLLEEDSLKWRNHRLSDLGILPRVERLEFFAPLSVRDIFQTVQSKDTLPSTKSVVKIIDQNLTDKYAFLKAALKELTHNQKERFWQELSHAAVNMHASLSRDFGDIDELNHVCDYVKFLSELGLFQACRAQLDKAASTLAQTSAKHLIRLGRTALLALRKRLLVSAKNNALLGNNFCHADSPLREVARALCLAEPRYYEGLLQPQKLTVRFFASKGELNVTAKAINELIFRAQLMANLGIDEKVLAQYKELSHGNIFTRFLINKYFSAGHLWEQPSPQMMEQLFDKDNKLVPKFIDFAKELTKQLSIDSPTLEAESSAEEHALNFLTVILVQLEQNWQLAIN